MGAGSPLAGKESGSPPGKEWFPKILQKLLQAVQTPENQKMIQVYVLDPMLNHVLERLFPQIVIFCVLFVVLTLMMGLTFVLLFTRFPAALATAAGTTVVGST